MSDAEEGPCRQEGGAQFAPARGSIFNKTTDVERNWTLKLKKPETLHVLIAGGLHSVTALP